MDGFDGGEGKQVFVIGATNRPDIIDPAIMRPGRLDKLVYVDVPNPTARAEILRTHTRKLRLAPDVDLAKLADDPRANGFTGADLAALTREAGTAALRRLLRAAKGGLLLQGEGTVEPPLISHRDLEQAFNKVHPSVSKRDLARYRALVKKMRGSRAVLQQEKPEDGDGPSASSGSGGAAATGGGGGGLAPTASPSD